MPFSFGDFTLDDSRRQLFRAGDPIRLSPKAYQLLVVLLRESPRAISKTDLQDRLWPGTFVGEGSLATLVTELRSALGDDAREPHFIRTLYGFGYSFAAPLNSSLEAAAPARHGPGHLTGAAIFGAIAIVLLLALRDTTGAPSYAARRPIRSIAVLPFDTMGADAADQHLGVGLPDLVITRLTSVRQLVVRPTSAIRRFVGRHDSSQAAGEKLKVDAVLDGSIRTTPDRIRVTVQLLDVRNQKPIWADRFDQKRTDMFALEDDISARVANALTLQLTPHEQALLAKRYTTDPAAYQLYVLGRYHLSRAGTARYYTDETATAINFLEQAVQRDPRFAPAWAELSRAYKQAGALAKIPPATAWPQTEAAAAKALQLDPNQSEAWASLAAVRAQWNLDFAVAERLFRRALDLNPREMSALMGYGILLQDLGRFDESIAVAKRLTEADPLDTNAQWRLANAYLTAGQYDRAMPQITMVLTMDPDYEEARIGLSRIHVARGQYDQAIAELRNLSEKYRDGRSMAFLGYALGRAGHEAEAREILRQIHDSAQEAEQRDFHLAVVHAGLGDRDAIFPLLERALQERTYARRLKTEPVFEPYRSDPRFVALLRRAGFKG